MIKQNQRGASRAPLLFGEGRTRFPLRHMLQLLLTILLSPLLALQALWVGARAKRLPEAAGPRAGSDGTGPDLRLLIIGDSSAAGVGVANQRDAMGGQLVQQLAHTHRVHWTLKAKTGATTSDALRWLQETSPNPIDIAVVIFGVNDTKNGMSRARWRNNLRDITHHLRNERGAQQVLFLAVPPLGAFPLLPLPLRWVLGQRADVMAQDMEEVLSDLNATLVKPDLPLDPTLMAADGFHPGPEIYTYCAETIANAIALPALRQK